MPKLYKWLAISLVVIVLDQLTKQWVVSAFYFGEQLPMLDFFNLVYARNTGAAFSFLADAGGWQHFFFIGIAVVASVLILYFLHKHAHELMFCWALSLILGGAIGNLIDRVRLNYVIDFLDFHYAGYHFPAFNVADSAITVGAALLILDSFRKKDGVQ